MVGLDKYENDTIFALATAPGRAGVAVIRVSGPRSRDVIEFMTGSEPPEARRMSVRLLRHDGVVLDEALIVFFENGRSFTGEDMVEFQVHGGRAVAAGVLAALSGSGICRTADPGEFTRRALENGRLDLAQVEGLADLIDAETEAQRSQAVALMKGELSNVAKRWRDDLVHALALLEASIDFADEDDAPLDVSSDVSEALVRVHRELLEAVDGANTAERIREGFVVALVGPPNSGKSSLLNALIGREAAIASAVAGTTRDIIETACDFDGTPVLLTDMAGIRSASDEVEAIGIDRALRRAEEADLRVFLNAPDVHAVDMGVVRRHGDISVSTKNDLTTGGGDISVSVVTGEGLSDLRSAISNRLLDRVAEASLLGRARQKAAVLDALTALDGALSETRVEIQSALISSAVVHLSALLGEVNSEAVLDEVFSRFCMGK